MEFAESVGRELRGGEIIALYGPVGCGKTVLAKGLARGLGIVETVVSPSFALVVPYSGRLPILHIDLYRLSGPGEARALAIEELLTETTVLLVEWAERAPEILGPAPLILRIAFADGNARRIEYEDPRA